LSVCKGGCPVFHETRAKEYAKNREIVAKLQQGGYVIFLRHTKTDWSQKDIEPFNFNDCSTQRNLTEEGRAQAVKIGEAYRALNIPISEVWSSPFCRCKDCLKNQPIPGPATAHNGLRSIR